MLEQILFTKHLEEDEHITKIVHKHWLVGLRFLLLPTISFTAAWLILVLRHSHAAFVILGLWVMASVIWFLRNFLDYYLDAWIVTDHGIIDLEWIGWFHRQSARILYSDVQGVSYEIHGISGTLLRYGTVTVEKISTGASISLSEVPEPRTVESMILRNMETYLHSKNMKNAKHIEELLSQFVAQHVNQDSLQQGKNAVVAADDTAKTRPTKKSFSSLRIGTPRT